MNLNEYQTLKSDERLNLFLNTLSITNRTPEYYVNWDKVERETKQYELELNTLNYLIGKEDIYEETLRLFEQQPNLIKAIPSLIASRDKVLDILSIDENDDMSFERLDFSKIDTERLDYVYGVEAGLDSNARKNRSGTTMEGILERHVSKLASELGLEWKAQATAAYIKEKWNIEVPVDKSERRFDVAVYSEKINKLWLIETNYYGGGGSKLKAVAGEFTELSQFVVQSKDDVEFVWVTDGQGWKTAHLPLSEAFGHIVNVFNLNMLKNNYLHDLFNL